MPKNKEKAKLVPTIMVKLKYKGGIIKCVRCLHVIVGAHCLFLKSV